MDESRLFQDNENGTFIAFGEIESAITRDASSIETLVLDASHCQAAPELGTQLHSNRDTLGPKYGGFKKLNHLIRLSVSEQAVWSTTEDRTFGIKKIVSPSLRHLVIIGSDSGAPAIPEWENDDYYDFEDFQDGDLRKYLSEENPVSSKLSK